MKYFNGSDEDFIAFMKKLSQEIVHNTLDQQDEGKGANIRSNKRNRIEHSLQSVLPYSKY